MERELRDRVIPQDRLSASREGDERTVVRSSLLPVASSMTLALVSNRLPVALKRTKEGLSIRPNPGGVVAGLCSFHREFQATWFGWPGDVPEGDHEWIRARLASEFACYPVFLPKRLATAYYSGFSNGTLWPLFHSFASYARYSQKEWEAYKEANVRFADAVVGVLKAGDVLWVHDYHLMLLPQLVRERKPDAQIGFFLHTPFPPYDILRSLPWSRDILEGVLGADLVGFHTYDYAVAFLGSVRRVLGLDNEIGTILLGSRPIHVDVFPLGIDFEKFAESAQGPAVARMGSRLRRGAKDSRLVFSISRLDYTKGIPQQLEAYERFLEQHLSWRGRVTYLLCVVPSREQVRQYAQLKRQIDERVGRINSRYGTLGWTPIRYLYRRFSFDELLALYRASDVALITPLRDGMNLIAKEYVASRVDERGVLILGEMAGASKELLEALIVNPNDVGEVSDAILRAVTMSEDEQSRRIAAMRDRLQRHDAQTWAARFIEPLKEVVRLSRDLAVRTLTESDRAAAKKAYRSAARRLILLDYDGTLVPFSEDRSASRPDARLSRLLRRLASEEGTHVVLVSGRTRPDLERWFPDIPLAFVAEHGGWIRPRSETTWEAMLPLDTTWKDRVRPVISRFVDRVPGSSIEEKDFSIAWHYRAADIDTGAEAAKELVHIATALTANLDLKVLPGSKVVEIRRAGVDKGTHVAWLLSHEPWDFIFAAGDDRTDESLFAILPSGAFSIRVGFAASAARFNVRGPEELVDVLEALAA